MCSAMERIGALCFVLTFVSVCQSAPQDVVNVTAVDGRLGIGKITGGTFGPGSFSIGADGRELSSTFITEDGVPVVTIKPKPHRDRNRKPSKHMEDDADVESGQGGRGGAGGKGGGQITIGKVIAKNNNNQENRRENNNQEPGTLLEAISSSNGPINMSIGNPASVARKPITGGGSEAGAQSINDQNVRPGNNNSKKTVNEFNNEGAGDGSHDNGNDNGHEYTGGPDEPWVWS
ncbi:uncharacterized protein LOC118275472 [Spodoptera frugiperda]|uniref:Uncharacterized protein LOC118275472 n=1 Tax=Spodoptera frugiperda TaxID=7108 RepID=A0A9R0DDN9_SPOFR|nr:uncharacterized protein LOC118275472 [Spodoptera frugiperda]